MAKPKAKTLQQKLGFFDDDLTNPDHDDIMKWLHKNIDKVITEIYCLDKWNERQINSLKDSVKGIIVNDIANCKTQLSDLENDIKDLTQKINSYNKILDSDHKGGIDIGENFVIEQIEENEKLINKRKKEKEFVKEHLSYLENFEGLKEPPIRNAVKILDIEWEHTVTSQSFNDRTGYKSNKYIIGYIDMKVKYSYSKLEVSGVNFDKEKIYDKIQWSQSNRKNSEEIITNNLFVEVKTKIKSLGSLFRQLRAYQEYETGDFAVICPDDSNKDIIRSQGFKFFKFKN